jgi:carbamate kinase
VAAAAEALARVAEEHEIVVAHALDVPLGGAFALALRNALPDRDVATVLVDTVVGADDPGLLDGPPVLEPEAIVELGSLRTLIDAGVLVICAGGVGATVTVSDGTMQGIEAAVDMDLTAALLARRLDADLLVMLTAVASEPAPAKVKAARRFVETTGRRAAIGELAKAIEIVRGEAGTQISATATG